MTDPRLDCAQVGTERRYAVLAADHPLAGQATMRLADLAGETVAVDVDSGTTTEGLWGQDAGPAGLRMIHGVDEWLNLIASGRVVGVSSEATAAQHPRPGVAFRPLEDAPSIGVWLAWWKDDVPPLLEELVEITRAAYARSTQSL